MAREPSRLVSRSTPNSRRSVHWKALIAQHLCRSAYLCLVRPYQNANQDACMSTSCVPPCPRFRNEKGLAAARRDMRCGAGHLSGLSGSRARCASGADKHRGGKPCPAIAGLRQLCLVWWRFDSGKPARALRPCAGASAPASIRRRADRRSDLPVFNRPSAETSNLMGSPDE